MIRTLGAAMVAAMLVPAAPALAQDGGDAAPSRIGEQATIPFVSTNIRTFRADDNGRGVFIQDHRRNWYYARFFSRCHELPFAFGVGFKSWGDSLSRGDSILVRGEQCHIAELTHSAPPPEKKKGKKDRS